MDKPDALKITGGGEPPKGISPLQWMIRQRKMLDTAAKIMGVAPTENLYKRNQPGGFQFYTRRYEDTLCFPIGHDLEGHSRYTWTPHPEIPGVMVGMLVPEAKEEPANAG